MSHVIHLNEQNFENEALRSPVPILVDFFATWCPPCQQIAPMLDQLAQEVAWNAKVGKVNVDENQQLAAAYRIEAVPTLIVFKNGQIVERLAGVQPKRRLLEALT